MKKVLALFLIIPFISFSQMMYVDAKSGLNYRATPKGKKLGKFPNKTRVKIVESPGVYGHLEDEGVIIDGEWVGVEKDDRTVYVFNTFLTPKKPVDNYKIFKYEDALCDCVAKYDRKKYSEKQIKNVSDYFVNDLGQRTALFFYDSSPTELNYVEKLNVNEYLKKVNNEIQFLKELDVPNAYWRKRCNEEIALLKAQKEFNEISILGYKNPEELLKYEVDNWEAENYREILIKGGQEMLDAWHDLIQEQKVRNGSPQSVEREYRDQLNSARKYDYARMDLMCYRWGGAIRKPLPKTNYDKDDEEFVRLFFNLNCGCSD